MSYEKKTPKKAVPIDAVISMLCRYVTVDDILEAVEALREPIQEEAGHCCYDCWYFGASKEKGYCDRTYEEVKDPLTHCCGAFKEYDYAEN